MIAGLKRRLARLEAVRLATDEPQWPTIIKIIAVPAIDGRLVPGWTPEKAHVVAVITATALSPAKTAPQRGPWSLA
jgi:hypothetical protein